MNHPENEPDDSRPEQQPQHAEFQHRAHTALVPEDVGQGVFANGAIVLTGQFEVILDFVLRLGRPERVAARVVLPFPVAEQFVTAMRHSVQNYTQQFGPIPEIARPVGGSPPPASGPTGANGGTASASGNPTAGHGNGKGGVHSGGPTVPGIDEVYQDLKLDESVMTGRYANAVLIRHSATEFCLDFVANIYPRSSVSARVFLAAPQIPPLLHSLDHSCQQLKRRREEDG